MLAVKSMARRCAPIFVAACLLAPSTGMRVARRSVRTSSHALQRRAFVQAATVSVTGLASGCHATAGFLEAAPELRSDIRQKSAGRPPNAKDVSSGPLANSPLGFQVGGGPRPEAEVREIDKKRYEAAAGAKAPATADFLDGVPRGPLP